MNNTNTEIEAPVRKAGLVKRTLAGAVDLFFLAFLYLMLLSFVTMPIAKAFAPQYDEKFATYVKYFEESGLVEKNSDTGELKEVTEDKYIEVSKYYFETYCQSEGSGNACSVYGKKLYEVVNENEVVAEYATMKDDYTYEIKDKYKDEKDLDKQINLYIYRAIAMGSLEKCELFSEPYNYVNNVIKYSRISAIAVGAIVVYVAVPLIAKRGRTLGKMTFKLALTNSSGFKVKTSQVLVRALAFSVINLVVGLMTTMIVPFVSFAVMIFTKRNSALHDYCAVTMVVDDKNSVIYNSKEDFDKAKEREIEMIAEIDTSRKEYYDSLKKE